MYSGFIYLWENIDSGMKYVGSHKGTDTDGYIGSGKRFLNAYKKHGPEKFVRKILEYVADEELILEREQHYLTAMNCASDPNFYNISPTAGGGDCGNGKKISSTKRKKFKNGDLEAHNKGKPMSDEQKEKLSDEWCVRTPYGEEIIVTNMLQYCRQHGLNASAMSSVARGNRRTYKGYWCKKVSNKRNVNYVPKEWSSKGHASKIMYGARNGMSKAVELDGTVYESMTSAAHALGISMYLLRKRLSNEK